MRLAAFTALVLLGGCSRTGDIVRIEQRWWGTSTTTYSSEAEAQAAIQEERARAIEVAKKLPFDYLNCSERLLAREIREQDVSRDHPVYVAIMGSDPDSASITSLKVLHPKVLPKSALPAADSVLNPAPGIRYNVYSLHKLTFWRGYEAYVSYYCGALCAGGHRYRIEKDGDSCKVISREQYGPVS